MLQWQENSSSSVFELKSATAKGLTDVGVKLFFFKMLALIQSPPIIQISCKCLVSQNILLKQHSCLYVQDQSRNLNVSSMNCTSKKKKKTGKFITPLLSYAYLQLTSVCLHWKSHPAKIVGSNYWVFIMDFRTISHIADLLMMHENPWYKLRCEQQV